MPSASDVVSSTCHPGRMNEYRLISRSPFRILLLLPGASAAQAQQPPTEPLETVEIVGSHIQGAQLAVPLPVTVLTPDQIAATGAVTGNDLLRSIPQMGDVTFNDTNDQQTSNAARGDVASIDLRGSGLGDTLVLLNGRRMVEHPTSQSRSGVPLISYNAQSLPTVALQRVEVLRQGNQRGHRRGPQCERWTREHFPRRQFVSPDRTAAER